jgi:hypothetical protein
MTAATEQFWMCAGARIPSTGKTNGIEHCGRHGRHVDPHYKPRDGPKPNAGPYEPDLPFDWATGGRQLSEEELKILKRLVKEVKRDAA